MAYYKVNNPDYSNWNNRTTQLSNEELYINMQVYNDVDASELIVANYTEYRNQPLLLDGTNYKLTITNLYAPTTNIPLFRWDDFLPDGITPKYTVSLSIINPVSGGTITFIAPVPFIPFKILDVVTYKFVYTFNQLVLMMNQAFKECFDGLVAAYNLVHGGSPWSGESTYPQEPPKLVFNPETQLFSLVVPFLYNADMDNSDPLNPTGVFVQIAMNWNTFNLFQNFPAIASTALYNTSPNGLDVIIRVYNTMRPNALTPKQFYVASDPAPGSYVPDDNWVYNIEQQDPSIDNISQIRSIVITSTMPVRSEYENVKSNQSGSLALINILADFAIDLNTPGAPILYTPSPYYKYLDILSDIINNLNYQINYADQSGALYPLLLSPGDTVEMKMLFVRK